MKGSWSGEARFQAYDLVTTRHLGAESLLLHRGTLESYGLDEAGTGIWKALLRGETFASICDGVAGAAAVEPEMVEADTQAFIEELMAVGVLRLCDERSPLATR